MSEPPENPHEEPWGPRGWAGLILSVAIAVSMLIVVLDVSGDDNPEEGRLANIRAVMSVLVAGVLGWLVKGWVDKRKD